MESAVKQRSSDSLSEENDPVDQIKCDTATATATAVPKRSYGCIFCKRGFTNAQALGGHMNIHRKDRTKAKQPTSSSVPSRPSNEEYMNPRYVRAIPTLDPSKYSSYGHYEELLGANLSLQIGPTNVDDSEMMIKRIMKEDEVDLELRLGHHP